MNLGNTVWSSIRKNSQNQTIECTYRHPVFGIINKFVLNSVFLPIFGYKQ